MSNLRRRGPAILAVILLALGLRLAAGPGGGYLYGLAGSSDEYGYIGEGLYIAAARDGTASGETLFSYTPPMHQLVLSLAPSISPFTLEQIEASAVAPPSLLSLRASDGSPYTLAYLRAGLSPADIDAAIEELRQMSFEYSPNDAREQVSPRASWLDAASQLLASGEPAVVSALFKESLVNQSPGSGPLSFATDPLLEPRPDGLHLTDRLTGEKIAQLSSDGIVSSAVSIGAGDPASISIVTADRTGTLRIWRLSHMITSPWRSGLVLGETRVFDQIASVAPSPSGDLILASVRQGGIWKLLTIETAVSYSIIGSIETAGPLVLGYSREGEQTTALGVGGETMELKGGPIWGVRILIAIVGALGALCAWLLGSRLGGRSVGLLAGLIFAVDPLGVVMGRLGYQDELLATLTIAAAAAIAGSLSPLSRRRLFGFLLAGLLGGMAAATKAFGAPVLLFSIYAGALVLSAQWRAPLGVLGVVAGLVGVASGGVTGAHFLIPAGVIAIAMSLALWRWRGHSLGPYPLLLSICGALIGYAVPWIVRASSLSLPGQEITESIVEMHRTIFNTASQDVGSLSLWWLWPGSLTWADPSAGLVEESAMFLGVTLAAGLGTLFYLRRPQSLLLGLLMILLLVSWAVPTRSQMPYYALPVVSLAGVLIALTARESPRSGRTAIALVLLTPLAAMFFYQEGLNAVLMFALSGLSALLLGLPLRRYASPRWLSALAWPGGFTLALAAAVTGSPPLAIAAGLCAAVAGMGGWSVAPAGVILASALALTAPFADLIRLLPRRIDTALPQIGDGAQAGPIALVLAAVLFGVWFYRQRGAERETTKDQPLARINRATLSEPGRRR